MTPEQVLRNYFHAKDENRPHLLSSVFSPDARLQISNRSDQISFPDTTVGLKGIEDVLVRRFNQVYENIYSFCLARPRPSDESFSCDWLVGMTDKASGAVRVGCGRYDWTFQSAPTALAVRLIISIEVMLVLRESRASAILGWLRSLQYPWSSAAEVRRTLPPDDLSEIGGYLGRSSPG